MYISPSLRERTLVIGWMKSHVLFMEQYDVMQNGGTEHEYFSSLLQSDKVLCAVALKMGLETGYCAFSTADVLQS